MLHNLLKGCLAKQERFCELIKHILLWLIENKISLAMWPLFLHVAGPNAEFGRVQSYKIL